MSATESLRAFYDSIDHERIARFVDEHYQENHTLDFKTLGLEEGWQGLTKVEKKNLAKGLSGFANTGGGILVWGVEASKDADGVDAASGLSPIPNVGRALSVLQSATHQAASPPVPGVEHKPIDSEGAGYIVTFVPESDSTPHMAKFGLDHYYARCGDSFVKMEHQQIADMFGRRPHPKLEIYHEITRDDTGQGGMWVEIGIQNAGRATAHHVVVHLHKELSAGYQWTDDRVRHTRPIMERIRTRRTLDWDVKTFTSEVVIHPEELLPLKGVLIQASPRPTEVDDLYFKYQLMCEDMPPSSDIYKIGAVELRKKWTGLALWV